MVTTYLGFLETAFLVEPFMSGTGMAASGVQTQMIINDSLATGVEVHETVNTEDPNGVQTRMHIAGEKIVGVQVQETINDTSPIGVEFHATINTDDLNGVQAQMHIDDTLAEGVQAQMHIDDAKAEGVQAYLQVGEQTPVGVQVQETVNTEDANGIQAQMSIADSATTGAQFRLFVNDTEPVGLQVQGIVDELDGAGIEYRESNLLVYACGYGFCEGPWCSDPWLQHGVCSHSRMQVYLEVDGEKAEGVQVFEQINDTKTVGIQTREIINDTKPSGIQVNMLKAVKVGLQTRALLYNATRFRVLWEFPSRGVTGSNWTSNSTEPGDFSVLNLNNDIVEYYWRSATGVVTGIDLTCDTELVQGVYLDTLAILGHNMTTSAVVTLQGTNDVTFATVGLEETLLSRLENTYYIAPVLPLSSYRYWRIKISDSTNTDGYIRIGTVVFGSARIFFGECITDSIVKTKKHFADKVPTEGYTNVTNNRTVKTALRFEFRNLEYGFGNYSTLEDCFTAIRTSQKALWILDPRSTMIARFTAFAKLVEIPEERHNALGDGMDYIDLTVDVDESL